MAWKVSPDPLDFKEAIAWFRKRVPMTRAEYERLTGEAKARAFWISHVAQADVVGHALKAIDDAVAKGTTLDDFKKAVGAQLRAAWGSKVDDHAWRLETIFRQNVQNAYGAGRYRQATHPDVLEDRPVWMFDAILDGRETDICRACDGTKLEADAPWWQTHTPPLHFNCRSGFITLSEGQAGKLSKAPTAEPAEGFGAPLASDEPWRPEPGRIPEQLELDFSKKTKKAPKPPAAKLVEGVHIKGLSASTVDDKTKAAMLGAIADAATLRFLEANPLDELTVKPRLRSPGLFGEYIRTIRRSDREVLTRRLDVATDRPAEHFGHKWVPGAVMGVSRAERTALKAAKVTLRHEAGHHVALFDGSEKVDAIIRAAYARAVKAKVYISKYAQTDRDEYFAESYVAYYVRPKALKAHDPNGFAMVEEVLKLRGILP